MNLLGSLGINLPEAQRPLAQRYAEIDAKLVEHKWPATSPWWLGVFERVWDAQKFKRQWVLRVGRRGGKALALDTRVPTPSGWTTMGSIQAGNHVFDDRGKIVRVVAVSEVMHGHECFRVTFSDGVSIVADGGHLWRTLTKRDRKDLARKRSGIHGRVIPEDGELRTTKEIAASLIYDPIKLEYNHSVPVCGALSTPYITLPIDPYVLGAWLGDGTSSSGGFTSTDAEIIDRIRSAGFEVRQSNRAVNPHMSFYIQMLVPELRRLGVLNNKHIPAMYLRASKEQRLALLQGLMDTDGTATREGKCNFDTTSPALRDGFAELCASLGIKARGVHRLAKLNGRVISDQWRFVFKAELPVFHLKRKLDRMTPIERESKARTIVAIEPVLSVPVRCIQVESYEGMFLVGDEMVPTHNSSSLCRLAVVEALYGDHAIPPGDVGIVGVVSISKSEAKKRLRTIKQILDVLGERYKPLSEGDGVELLSKPVAFQVLAAQIGSVVGGTWICGICDEVAHWRDKDTGVNPANEVLASMRPTMATMPKARMFLSSSVLGSEDAHAKAFDEGETARQSVASAPTWIANPTLTEALTRADEPNERVWLREYANKPQAAVSSVFDSSRIDACFVPRVIDASATPVMIIDASRGGDSFAFGILRWVWSEGRPRLQLTHNGETPPVLDSEDFTRVAIGYLVEQCKSHNVHTVCGDQYEAGSLRTLFSQHGLTFWEHVWTNTSKRVAVDRLERMQRDRDLILCESDKLRKQLREYRERITRNGDLVYGGSGPTDDYVQVLMTGVMADGEKRLEMVEAPTIVPVHGSDEYWRARERAIEEKLENDLRERQREDALLSDGDDGFSDY